MPEVAHRLGVTRQTVYNWAGRLARRDESEVAARLSEAPRRGRPCSAAGVIDPLIDEVIDEVIGRDPRELDYRSTVWTASLLVAYLRDEHQLSVSDDSLRLAIARPSIRWKRPRRRLALAARDVAAGQRGLKRGLAGRERTVSLMLDEVIICQTPPLYSCYCRIGEQCRVPVTGDRQKRILHGVMKARSGDVLLLITKVWDELTHQYFLRMIRARWRGWQLILFEDRGTPHTAEESREYAAWLGIEVRLLPRATPELNATAHLWRSVKGRAEKAIKIEWQFSIESARTNSTGTARQFKLRISSTEKIKLPST